MNAVDGLQSLLNTAEATQKLREILNVGVGQAKVFEAGGAVKAQSCFNGNTEGYSAGTRMLESLNKMPLMDMQTLILNGASENQSFDIYSPNVTVVVNSLNNHLSGSSRVRIKNIVDYGWEQKYYTGRLLATHLSGNYIAYSIFGRDKMTGIVRVINVKSGERTLVKISGMVKDLSFAHISDQVVLAFVDEIGNLYVHEIQDENGKLTCTSLLTITQPENVKATDYHRVIWCQYIPEESAEDTDTSEAENCNKLLVVTHDEKAEMLNVELIVQKYGNGPIASNTLSYGYQIISEHNQPVIDGSFSPDGVALATASLDGEVQFFQVNIQETENTPKLLHRWTPHEGKPLSCLFFLDNHKMNATSDTSCWKFAVTGANYNREIKVWSCQTWCCLQTIKFEIPEGESLEPSFKAGLDLSATYLMLSDVTRKVFYTLILKHDLEQNLVSVCSLTAFPLPFPILSYSVVDASRKKYKQSVDNEHIVSDLAAGSNDDFQDDESENLIEGIVVRLFYIQPKSLQECRIAYQPNSTILFPNSSVSSLSQDSFAFRDHISDMSYDTSVTVETDNSQDMNRSQLMSQTNNLSNQVLLTPEAFTSSPIHGTPATSVKVIFPSPLSSGTPSSIPLPPVTPSEEAALATPTEEAAATVSEVLEHDRRSSSSSPCLEIQQILAPTMNESANASTINNFDQLDSPAASTSKPDVTNMDNNKFVSLSPFNKQPSPNIREYDTTIWPLAPNLQPEIKLSNTDQQFADATEKDDANMSGGGEPCASNSMIQQPEATNRRVENALMMMQGSVEGIRQMLQLQQKEIMELRHEFRAQQNTESKIHQEVGRFTNNMTKLESSITAMIERNLVQLKQCDNRWSEDLIRNIDKREQQTRDRLMSGVAQIVANAVNSKLESCVKHEMKSIVLPVLTKSVDAMKDHIQTEIAQKLAATDSLLKENIGKMIKSKSVVDAIGNSAATVLHQTAPAAFKDIFQAMILPSFEKACQKMFEQINGIFHQGTKEYIHHVDRHFDQRRRLTEQACDPILTQLQSTVASFQSTTEQLTTNVITNLHSELERQLKTSILNLQDILVQRIHQHIRNEIDNAMKEQKNMIGDSVIQAIRSRAVTPIPTVDPQIKQAQIMQLARVGQYNGAFQQALSASDLSLVTLLCQSIPPDTVFGQDVCPLQQPVLLSLIQQLSSDLSSHTELKLKYLQDALFNLDKKSPITKDHVAAVLQTLNTKLRQFVQGNPSSEYSRMAKMMLLAAQSI